MAEIAVLNQSTEYFSQTPYDQLNHDIHGGYSHKNSKRVHRKHRFTILIGYGEEAGLVLKRCEQLKCKLGISTNTEFLSFLIDSFEKYHSKETNSAKIDSCIGNGCDHASYENELDIPSTVNHKCMELQAVVQQSTITLTSNEPIVAVNDMEMSEGTTLEDSLNSSTSIAVLNETVGNSASDSSTSSPKSDVDVQCQYIVTGTEVVCQSINGTSVCPSSQRSDYSLVPGEFSNNFPAQEACQPPSSVMNQESEIDLLFNSSPQVIDSLEEMVSKTIQLIHCYIDNVKNESDYCYGCISSPQKLKTFLEEYRSITQSVFTVRSSRSYFKKRGTNQSAGNTQGSVSFSNKVVSESSMLPHRKSGGLQKLSENSFSIVHDDSNKLDTVVSEDSGVVGPLRWEFILGKPPIPFTGVPFFNLGNTQYQCLYASADIRTKRRKERNEQMKKENPDAKMRNRRSLKRDCKAQMFVKSIVTFPEYSIVDQLQGISSKKGRRKLKASTLDSLREHFEKGESIGQPAFWVHVPLPQAHSTHDLLDITALERSNNDTMSEIVNLLQLAPMKGLVFNIPSYPQP